MRESLEETLRTLHQQLAQDQELDAQQLDMLRQAVGEIEETLDRSDVDTHSLAQKMQADSLSFTESHPVLAQTIGRITDLLAQMGI